MAVNETRIKSKYVACGLGKHKQPETYNRKCLRCDRIYNTDNKFNRLCNFCNHNYIYNTKYSDEKKFTELT